MAAPDSRPTLLILSHPVYADFELDPRGPFYDIPRGGQSPPDDDFYMENRWLRETGKSTKPFFSCSVLIRGFDMTLRELWAVDNAVKQGVEAAPDEILDTRSTQSKARLWSSRVKILKRFIFLNKPFNHKTFGWWAQDAFCSWVLASKREIIRDPTLATNCAENVRRFDLAIDIPRPGDLHRPGAHDKYDLKDCFLRFSDPAGNVEYIPFTAIMTLQSPDDSDLYLGTTDISWLHQSPKSKFGICDPSLHVLKYTKRSSIGFVEEKSIRTSEDLRSAIMDLWRDGQQVFDLRVEPSEKKHEIKEEADAGEFESKNKGKKSQGRRGKKRKAPSHD